MDLCLCFSDILTPGLFFERLLRSYDTGSCFCLSRKCIEHRMTEYSSNEETGCSKDGHGKLEVDDLISRCCIRWGREGVQKSKLRPEYSYV